VDALFSIIVFLEEILKKKLCRSNYSFVTYNKINNDLAEGDSAFLSILDNHCLPQLTPQSTVFPQVDKMHCYPQQVHYKLYIILEP